jgi:hypothetical protein
MKTFTGWTRRCFLAACVSVSLLTMALSVSLAEGWGDLRGPRAAPASVTATEIVYLDGSELFPDGTYVYNSVTYSVTAAHYDSFNNLVYGDGTVLYSDGGWTGGTTYYP